MTARVLREWNCILKACSSTCVSSVNFPKKRVLNRKRVCALASVSNGVFRDP